jgi:hypothetical protein
MYSKKRSMKKRSMKKRSMKKRSMKKRSMKKRSMKGGVVPLVAKVVRVLGKKGVKSVIKFAPVALKKFGKKNNKKVQKVKKI